MGATVETRWSEMAAHLKSEFNEKVDSLVLPKVTDMRGTSSKVNGLVRASLSLVLGLCACSRGTSPPSKEDETRAEQVTMRYVAEGENVHSIRVTIPARDKNFEIELEPSRDRERIVSLAPGGARGQRVEWQQGRLAAAAGVGEFGKPHGIVYSFYDDGSIMAEHEYRNGERHGRTREWFENGQLRLSGANESTWPVGEWTQYFVEGGVHEITVYFPRPHTKDLGDLYRPLRRRRRCDVSHPFVEVVANGKIVANLECAPRSGR